MRNKILRQSQGGANAFPPLLERKPEQAVRDKLVSYLHVAPL